VIAVKAFERHSHAPFEQCYLNREVVVNVLHCLETEVQASSWNNFVGKYKRLAKWLSDADDLDCPKLWRAIRAKRIDWVEKLKDCVRSDAEIASLIEAADHPRDKALIGVIWEGGFRPTEILCTRMRDCVRTNYGFDVTVSGKTGTRSFPLVVTAPLLECWLYCHPKRDDTDAYVFMRRRAGRVGSIFERIKYNAADKRLQIIARTAGLKGHISLKDLRHTQATASASFMSDETMRKVFGWKPGSPMPSRYSHMKNVDAMNAVLKMRGVNKEATVEVPRLMDPKPCFGCGTINVFDATYCIKCALPLSREEAQKMMTKNKALNAFAERLEKDPEFYAKFKRMLDNL
jgi:hypothetical protein